MIIPEVRSEYSIGVGTERLIPKGESMRIVWNERISSFLAKLINFLDNKVEL